MIYTPSDSPYPSTFFEETDTHSQDVLELKCNRLFPPRVKKRAGLLGPGVVPPDLIKEWIHEGSFNKNVRDKGGNKEQVEDATDQPCSLDLLLREFTTREGNSLAYPFSIPSESAVVGHSYLNYGTHSWLMRGGLIPESVLCVDARTYFARRGLACLGFYSGNNNEPDVFLNRSADLSFVLKNVSDNSITIGRPLSPVQISQTREMRHIIHHNFGIQIVKDGKDVTEERETLIGRFVAYIVNLSDELVYMRKTNKSVSLVGNDIEDIVVRTTIPEIHRQRPGFCLTLTEEQVHTNGCPAYIFPFHYLDAVANPELLEDTSSLSKLFQQMFSDTDFLPVTANAGLINPGFTGRLVCENVTRGRDLHKYFRPHEPFALVIPVPFYDGTLDTQSYQGRHQGQNGIIF